MSAQIRGARARINFINARYPTAPMRRCADCALDLDPARLNRAFAVCPLFGFSRHNAELRCHRFEAKGVA